MVAWIAWLPSDPLWILLALTVPFALAAWLGRIYPHGAVVLLAMIPAGLSLLVVPIPSSWPWVLAVDGLLLAAVMADLAGLIGSHGLSVERKLVRIVSLRQRHDVWLTVTSTGRRPLLAYVRDGVPDEFDVAPEEFCVQLDPPSRTVLHYQLRANRRGAFHWDSVHFRVRSRFGLWWRYVTLVEPAEVFVYPDVRQLAEYELLARTDRLSLMGLRRTRIIGQEHDFERLRDYTRDDNYRHIDWRSSARRQRLTVKQFQTSQSQRIIFLLDCGRMMTNQAGELTLLDHALNAVLMLSYIALRRGDSVGLASFSDHVHSFVPPQGGLRQMNRLLHASFDRFPQLVESRYDEVFLYLAARCRKRSLVILITNVVDEVNAQHVQRYLGIQAGRHLPLGVLLRDRRLFDPVLSAPHADSPELYTAAAAAEIISWRQQLLVDLTHQGVLALDVFGDDLTAPLVNQYLEIKARNLL